MAGRLLVRPELLHPAAEVVHPLLVVLVKLVGLTLLQVGPVLYLFERQLDEYGDVLDTANVKVPPLPERFSDELRHLPLAEDFDDLVSGVPEPLLLGLAGDGVLVDLLAELAHGQLALLDGVHEGRGQKTHYWNIILFLLVGKNKYLLRE